MSDPTHVQTTFNKMVASKQCWFPFTMVILHTAPGHESLIISVLGGSLFLILAASMISSFRNTKCWDVIRYKFSMRKL